MIKDCNNCGNHKCHLIHSDFPHMREKPPGGFRIPFGECRMYEEPRSVTKGVGYLGEAGVIIRGHKIQ